MLFSSGAEAQLFKEGDRIVKVRPVKSYRIKHIDFSLRKFRTRREAKILSLLESSDIPAPKLFNSCDHSMRIDMSFIKGPKVRDVLDNYPSLSKEIGILVGKIHSLDIIHSDLTTSNMIFNDKVFLIDFGLSFVSKKIEDKAVDLHLLFQALESRHFKVFDRCKKDIISAYRKYYSGADSVLSRLVVVESRGRNKSDLKNNK